MPNIHATTPPRLPRLPNDDAVYTDARIAVIRPEEDLDGVRVADQRVDAVDLTATAMLDCAFERLAVGELVATRAHVRHTVARGCRAASCDIHAAGIEASLVEDCAFGAVQAHATRIVGVEIRGCRIDYLNCRSAVCRDLVFRDCAIGEFDGNDARLSCIAFVDTRVDILSLQHAACADVDLRGARLREIRGVDSLAGTTMTLEQIADLAAVFARSIGIRTS